MSRSNSSERRSRRRSSPRPSVPLSAAAEKRRKRRVSSPRQPFTPKGPVSPAQGDRQNYRQEPQTSGSSAYYLPPASLPYPSSYPHPPTYSNQPHFSSDYPSQPHSNQGYFPPSSNPQPLGQAPSARGKSSQSNGSSGSSRGPSRDIRFGPSPRRRHELSSNPAFGNPRHRQRQSQHPGRYPGAKLRQQSAPRSTNSQSVDLATSASDRPNRSQLPMPRQTGTQLRTQSLHPRPVSPSRSQPDPQATRQSMKQRRSPRSSARGQSLALAKPRQRRRPAKPVSPMVYGLRLLILGTGVGVIAGTVISTLNPSHIVQTAGMADVSAIGSGTGNESQRSAASIGGGGDGFSGSAIAGIDTIPKQQPYAELARELTQMAEAQSDLFPGVFVLDLDTYNYVDVNGSQSFSSASTIKLPILIAFFQDVEQNKIRLDEMLTMTEADVATGSGDMQYETVGNQYSALETATKMIVISDNTATNILIRRMGGMAALNQRFRSWGLSLTQLRNPLPDLEGTNTTSPSELTHLMALISQGQLLSLRSRDRVLDIMYRTQTNTLLPAGITEDVAIAHKTGDIGSMVGDTGLVDTLDGKRYAITIMMRRPHNDSRAQGLIRQMAGRIHTALQSPPALPTSPLPPETDSTGSR